MGNGTFCLNTFSIFDLFSSCLISASLGTSVPRRQMTLWSPRKSHRKPWRVKLLCRRPQRAGRRVEEWREAGSPLSWEACGAWKAPGAGPSNPFPGSTGRPSFVVLGYSIPCQAAMGFMLLARPLFAPSTPSQLARGPRSGWGGRVPLTFRG